MKAIDKFLKKLNEEGNTIVLITHDNSLAEQAKRIVRVQDGKLIYDSVEGKSNAMKIEGMSATVQKDEAFKIETKAKGDGIQ